MDTEVKIIAEDFKKEILTNNYFALFNKEKDQSHYIDCDQSQGVFVKLAKNIQTTANQPYPLALA